MSFVNDVQKLNPGDKVQLVIVDGSKFGVAPLYFHAHNIAHTNAEIAAANANSTTLAAKSIWHNGIEYGAYPYEITGLASSSDGQTAEPSLRVANINGTISKLCYVHDDMVQAKVTIIDTFAHYLDAKNNIAGATPDPTQIYKQVWYIDSKTAENNEVIEFRLASPIDLQGLVLPTRQITGICTWACRGGYKTGEGCSYNPASYGNRMFDLQGKPVTDQLQDKCSGLLMDCKKRFGEGSELDFGGFPGANLLRR
ncbi:hypothetical protein SB5439_04982 [Klebsiella variicola]|uniref:phage minor tail protein L n=1 Tax=Klebsiella variicola TaxID=244366 RepID=UPI00109C3941|nr:phage minor tail protein L [Klebsiella variicola]VGQ11685.1 hypothetical protein SB5439_04982 [Klebsiella variicola]